MEPGLRACSCSLETFTFAVALWTTGVAREDSKLSFALIALAAAAALALAIVGGDALTATVGLLSGLLTVATIGAIVLGVADQSEVNAQSVIGAICVYLLFGMLFLFLYSVAATLGSGPFFAQGTDGTRSIRLYFSYVTLATLGYGDYTPAAESGARSRSSRRSSGSCTSSPSSPSWSAACTCADATDVAQPASRDSIRSRRSSRSAIAFMIVCTSSSSRARSDARCAACPRSITVLVTPAVRNAMNDTPITSSTPPMIRPTSVVGTMSPYPTVVTVCSDHQAASPSVGKSCVVDDAHDDRSDDRERQEDDGQADCHRSRVGDPLNLAIDEGQPLLSSVCARCPSSLRGDANERVLTGQAIVLGDCLHSDVAERAKITSSAIRSDPKPNHGAHSRIMKLCTITSTAQA